MRLHRFIGEFDLTKDQLVLEGDLAHQLLKVFRVKENDYLVLCDGAKKEAVAQVVAAEKNTVHVRLIERRESVKEEGNVVSLFCALLKKDHFELVVQKAVESGVREIYPLVTERTIKNKINLERIQAISREAAELSGRGIVPFVHEPLSFTEALKKTEQNQQTMFFDLDAPFFQPLPVEHSATLGCFIGPEGGWSEAERQLAKEAGLLFRGLGSLALRAETAAIVAAFLLVHGGEISRGR